MDFQNNNNYVSWPRRNKLWLCLPSIPTNCEVYREALPGASSLMVTDDGHFRANIMFTSCLNKWVWNSSSLPLWMTSATNPPNCPTVVVSVNGHRLQQLTYSLNPFLWVTSFHDTWTNCNTKRVCYFSLTHCTMGVNPNFHLLKNKIEKCI